MELMKVDENGFDLLDRKYLLAIIETFGGGPGGINAIAAAIGEERGNIGRHNRAFFNSKRVFVTNI
ncbi:MAG: hypothetical protein Ct9H300mP4_09120 [Gammaproteobacteria bacterium]|nr:MAG: hypothetical protein Ct9H300mP4_09120 [Gammaproteobacteria bacterium]